MTSSFGHWNFSNRDVTATTATKKSEGKDDAKPVEGTQLEASYISLIDRYLQMHLIDNARWLAERCVAEFPSSPKAAYWLALCQFRCGKFKAARHSLDAALAPASGSNSKNDDDNMEYLKALCSLELQDYSRAEECLLRKSRAAFKDYQNSALNLYNVRGNNVLGGSMGMDEWLFSSNTAISYIPNGASGLCLLGNVFRASNRKQKAIQFYKASLDLDPFLWSSMEALAELGALEENTTKDLQPHQIALLNQNINKQNQNQTSRSTIISTTTTTTVLPKEEATISFAATPAAPSSPNPAADGDSVHEENGVSRVQFQTPGLTPIPPSSVSRLHRQDGLESPASQTPSSTTLNFLVNHPPLTQQRLETPGNNNVRHADTSNDDMQDDPAAPSERRKKLFSSITENSNFLSNAADGMNDTSRTPTTDIFEPKKSSMTSSATAGVLPKTSLDVILRLLSTVGTFYQHVCQYRCKEAIEAMRQLSWKQQNTGWVLHQQGRAHLELGEFTAAQRCLEQMQVRDPTRLDGLELLSTVYWHLKKEVELSYLAQRVLDTDRLSAVTWCVVGNCFSLQKDHETALVFFRRSLQLEPNFTYIHTLSGYEYMANEDFDKAIVCFRKALRVNERHYNAWYGLGAIFHRQEKYDLAEYHFERAVQLHPMSSILLCNLGIAQYANGKAYQALETLGQAFKLDPQNPQARFQRASIYAALHRPAEAYAELVKVRDSAPREAAVHFAMGKVLKRLGRPQEAITSFLTAMDLDPKDNQIIKSAMDKISEPDVGEESMVTF